MAAAAALPAHCARRRRPPGRNIRGGRGDFGAALRPFSSSQGTRAPHTSNRGRAYAEQAPPTARMRFYLAGGALVEWRSPAGERYIRAPWVPAALRLRRGGGGCSVAPPFSEEVARGDLAEMSDMDSYKVLLDGPAPWGFRLQGGKDFNMPLSISRLTPGGKAAQAGVGVGDWVLSIDGENTSSLTHIEAQNKIRACGDKLSLSLSRVQNLLGKPQKVSIPDLSSAPALKVEPGYGSAAPKPAPVSGPASRPPWAVDPSFAERYAPDKTSTVLSKHSQPATPTPMQNRNSIVQAAQQAPESADKTPICYQCNKIIRGRYLVALGRYYHPEEFTCSQCRKVLDEGGFFEEKGSIFCPKCYDIRYAPNCAKCKKKITGEIMHALKMTWHVHCFICAACKTPIRNRAFYMEEGQPYCERDYEKMFGTKCRGCDFKIDAGDRFLEALGFSWHDTCFVCAICQINLEGKTFYSKKDKPLCKSHAFSHV
ncbi:and LIM domain 7 isoform X1 [Podarcis lilfordi]|uniref:PDZ and LIM domain protein 7 n=1 Tax=Podarcis lilfordi TaxID=74358 RepID=A0AA35JXC0_9SAUR|nr:and LIM domain 7 isoform X1 [Podarcis lilfordi]